jgi:hypothetical protein
MGRVRCHRRWGEPGPELPGSVRSDHPERFVRHVAAEAQGEKIIQVRTRLDGSAPQWRAMEEMSAGPYVSTEAMTARAQNSVGHGRVETLVAAGVQRIYGGAGDSRNGITDAIRRRADIQ